MLKIFLLLIYVSLSLNYLTPDKYNAVLIEENEIKCHTGKITYKINNYQTKQYLLFLKENMIPEFDLYEDNTRITYETYSDNKYFFRIKSNIILYLVVNINTKYSYCISFKFVDSNPIILKNNEEFLYPILNTPTTINMIINNVANKHFIFNLNNIESAYSFSVSIEGKKTHYFATRKELTSLIIQDNEINMKVSISGPSNTMVVSLKYLSVTYSNITGDIFKCIDSPQSMQSYFLNSKELKNTNFLISSTNKNIEIYDNGNLIKTLNYYDFNSNYLSSPYSYILQRDRGCFQLLTSGNIIKNGQTIKILNSEIIPFTISFKDSEYIILSIYSSENNFIEQLKLKEDLQNLEIHKNNDKYYYNFKFENEYYNNIINIKFNLNSKDYIIVNFEIQYKYSLIWLYILLLCIGCVAFIIIIRNKDKIIEIIEKICKKCPHEKRKKERLDKIEKELREVERKKKLLKEKEKEEKLLEKEKYLAKISDLYNSIKNNYSNLNQVCLICLKGYFSIKCFPDENDKIDIIDEINKGKFDNFKQYITPEKCEHFYHKNCFVFKNECKFCKLFITTSNIKKFGLFFSENDFKQIFEGHIYNLENLQRDITTKIENIFYSEIEKTTWGINQTKKETLLRLRKINQKYLNNYDIIRKLHKNNYFEFYKISINHNLDNLDELERDLDYEIQTERENERRERERYKEQQNRYEENIRNNEPIKLKRCHECQNVCPLCRGKVESYGGSIYAYYAHYKCIKDKKSCCICHYNEGIYDCKRCCEYCYKTKKFAHNYCYYCKKRLVSYNY